MTGWWFLAGLACGWLSAALIVLLAFAVAPAEDSEEGPECR